MQTDAGPRMACRLKPTPKLDLSRRAAEESPRAKGKLVERRGRKATGLTESFPGQRGCHEPQDLRHQFRHRAGSSGQGLSDTADHISKSGADRDTSSRNARPSMASFPPRNDSTTGRRFDRLAVVAMGKVSWKTTPARFTSGPPGLASTRLCSGRTPAPCRVLRYSSSISAPRSRRSPRREKPYPAWKATGSIRWRAPRMDARVIACGWVFSSARKRRIRRSPWCATAIRPHSRLPCPMTIVASRGASSPTRPLPESALHRR